MAKCDYCDQEAVHFTSQGVSQSCDNHIVDANETARDYWKKLSKEVDRYYSERAGE